jgi:hypothetical protein
MHRTAACREAWSARGGAGTRRIAAGTAGTLKDGTATLNDAWARTWASRRTGTLRRNWARRRRTVDRPRAGLRHDHTLDGRCRCCRGFRCLRCWSDRRRRYRRCSNGRRSYRRCGDGCGLCRRRRSRSGRRTRHHRARRSCRGDSWTLGRGSGRSRGRDGRTSDNGSGRGLRGNGRSRRRRRGHDRRRLTRLRHNNATRGRSFGLGCRGGRRTGWRRGGTRCSGRRCRRLSRGRRRSLRTRRGALGLFFALLDGLQDVAGFGHLRPVDSWSPAVLVAGRGGAAIPAASTLEMRAHTLRLIGLERAGVGLGLGHSNFAQYVQNRLALDFELSC